MAVCWGRDGNDRAHESRKKDGARVCWGRLEIRRATDSLGIKDIELPAKRPPRAEDALKELDKLRDGTAHR